MKGGFGIRQGGSEYAVVYRQIDRYAKNNRDVDRKRKKGSEESKRNTVRAGGERE